MTAREATSDEWEEDARVTWVDVALIAYRLVDR